MNKKAFLKAVSVKAARTFDLGKKLAKSYIGIFLVIVLCVTSTLAWFTEHKTAKFNVDGLEFQSASSLRINQEQSAYNTITIPAFTLDEVSSYDGRNIFFPVGESFTTTTSEMYFREANKGDENVHYVYKDFYLKGSSGRTDVFIKSYKITIEDATGDTDASNDDVNGVYQDELIINHDASTGKIPESQHLPPDYCPIRLAFIADSAKSPKVIDPSAQVKDYAENSYAVAIVDDKGVPELKLTDNESFASYYYGNTPLFTILPNQNLDVTLVIWLEGTMGNSDKFIGKKISVDIDIESNFAEMETIKFVDGTKPDSSGGPEHWVANDDPIIACSYKDPYSEENRWKTVMMTKSDFENYTWTAQIPKKAVSDIAFYRLSKPGDREDNPSEPHSTIYNAWYTSTDKASFLTYSSIPTDWYVPAGSENLQTTRQVTVDGVRHNETVYTAVHGNGRGRTTDKRYRLAACVGYWGNQGGSGSQSATESGGSSTVAPTESGQTSHTITIDVECNNQPWVYNNVIYNGMELYAVASDNHDYKLNNTSTSNHIIGTLTLDVGVQINSFVLKKVAENYKVTNRWTPDKIYKVKSSGNPRGDYYFAGNGDLKGNFAT